jgi:hypothetical protein
MSAVVRGVTEPILECPNCHGARTRTKSGRELGFLMPPFHADLGANSVVIIRRISSASFGRLRNLPTFPWCWNSANVTFNQTVLRGLLVGY